MVHKLDKTSILEYKNKNENLNSKKIFFQLPYNMNYNLSTNLNSAFNSISSVPYLSDYNFTYICSNKFGTNLPNVNLTGFSEFDALFINKNML
jgi:hypothetical protein